MVTEIGKTKIILMSAEMGGAMIGNILLLVLIMRSKKLKHSASITFIFNCALSDLTNVMVNIPFAMDYTVLKTGNLDGAVMPIVTRFVITFLLLLTLHSTLLMMADRYLIVKYPVMYNNMVTAKRAWFSIAIMWLSTVLISAVLNGIRYWRNPPLESDTAVGYFQKQHQSGGKLIVFLVSFTIFTSVAVLCGKLYQALQSTVKKNLDDPAMSEADRLKVQAHKRKIVASCRTVLLVMVIYMLSYFPTMLNAIINIFDVKIIIVENLLAFITLFCANLSSFFNPLVFILRSSSFRKSAIGLLGLDKARKETSEVSPDNQQQRNDEHETANIDGTNTNASQN